MFIKWRIVRLKRKQAILRARFDLIVKLDAAFNNDYYTSKLMALSGPLAALTYDLGVLEDKL